MAKDQFKPDFIRGESIFGEFSPSIQYIWIFEQSHIES